MAMMQLQYKIAIDGHNAATNGQDVACSSCARAISGMGTSRMGIQLILAAGPRGR